jgi:hypothetical protein
MSHMQIEDLEFEDGDHGYFENMPDHDCFIWAQEIEDGFEYGCAVNPNLDPGRELGALGWCAEMVTRIEAHGFDRAMEMDGWQHRSDGKWQLWGRAVHLPSPD